MYVVVQEFELHDRQALVEVAALKLRAHSLCDVIVYQDECLGSARRALDVNCESSSCEQIRRDDQ